MRATSTRVLAIGGIVGPTAFVGAWVVGSAIADGYSLLEDPISRLAAVGVDTRPLMTGGFVVFGLSLPLYAAALRRSVEGPAWIAAATTGIATLAVAATPLDRSATVDAWHGVAAGAGYLTLVAVPLLAARPLFRSGHRTLAGAGVVAGAISATALVLTATALPTGLFQRIGLTVTDLWIVASAAAMWRGVLGRPRR
ncbi:MAG: DUF998 domain-containing protein [Acidimicrobiales bacterium]